MSTQNSKIKNHIVFWGACLFYVLLFLFICSSRTGNKVLKFKYASLANLFVPNRWALYTKRTAVEKIHEVYEVQNGKAMLLDNRPFAAKMLFGIRRDCKIIACETDLMTRDTAFLPGAVRYYISMPQNGDINQYLKPDTLRYTDYHSENVLYLKGRILITIAEPVSWQQARHRRWPAGTVTVIPINIIPGK
jgi:hypothetical protein